MSIAKPMFNAVDFWGALVSGYSFIGLNILLQIVLVPLYLQHLGKADFGILMILLSSINFLSLGIYGLSGKVLRNLSAHAIGRDDTAYSRSYTQARCLFAVYTLSAAILGLAAFFVFSDRAALDESRPAGDSILWAAAFGASYFIVNVDFNIARLGLNALHRQTAANVLQIVAYLVFAALVLPWIISGGGLAGVTGALFAGIVVARICTAVYARRQSLPMSWRPGPNLLRASFAEYGGREGRLYLLYGAIFIAAQSDSLLIGWLTDPHTVADYVLIWKIAEVLLLVLWRVPEYLQATFARMEMAGNYAALTTLYQKSLLWLRILAAAIGVAYALTGHQLVELWVGAAAAPNNPWGYVLAGGAIFWLASARLPAALATMQTRHSVARLISIAGAEIGLKVIVIALIALIAPHTAVLSALIAVNALHLLGFHYLYIARLKPVAPSRKDPRDAE